tara:strand:- start:671 stop:1105 length:435 start_codon:yes stop_codon:yes gene_type:complete
VRIGENGERGSDSILTFATAFPFSTSRTAMTMKYFPVVERARTVSLPRPEDAPVTTTSFLVPILSPPSTWEACFLLYRLVEGRLETERVDGIASRGGEEKGADVNLDIIFDLEIGVEGVKPRHMARRAHSSHVGEPIVYYEIFR